MIYYNADGNQSSMCGNGGRCLVKFASEHGIYKSTYHFIAIDGEHKVEIVLWHYQVTNAKCRLVAYIICMWYSYRLSTFYKVCPEVADIDVVSTI